MTDAEKMAEMEALLRELVASYDERQPARLTALYDRAATLLAPPPDLDALAKEVFSVGNSAVGPAGGMQAEWAVLSSAGHARYRAIAAWVEADRRQVRRDVLTAAADMAHSEREKRNILTLRDGGGWLVSGIGMTTDAELIADARKS